MSRLLGSNRRKTVLVADSCQRARTILCESLREAGFTICGEAGDGLDAIEKAEELRPDLVILGERMPCLDGVPVATILRHTKPKLRIMLMSSHPESLGEAIMAAIRIDAVVSKLDGIDKIIEIVRNLLTS